MRVIHKCWIQKYLETLKTISMEEWPYFLEKLELLPENTFNEMYYFLFLKVFIYCIWKSESIPRNV